MPTNNDYSSYKIGKKLNKDKLPTPIFDHNTAILDLYWKAWEIAWDHVLYREDSPQKLYLDEAMTPDTIWIWDTLFMAQFCKYGFKEFPGIESLNNFYFIIHDKKKHPARVQHPDNPAFFSWVEYEYAKITGDIKRLRWILQEKRYLQKHFEFIETSRRFKMISSCNIPMMVKKTKLGYTWTGTSSGMDNTPRARGKYWKILWIDLIFQQGLSALYISSIAALIKDSQIERTYYKKYLAFKDLVNRWYWDRKTGFYYDLYRYKQGKMCKVVTPASFWAMLAEFPSEEQAEHMLKYVTDPVLLGGFVNFPSVARNDKDFDSKGQYWRGGIWIPMCYLGVKALEKYDEFGLARSISENLLYVMWKTYENFHPQTIWESYCPVAPKPSTYKRNTRYVRPNFCGWSALGPISLLIENVLGFYSIDAFKRQIHWSLNTGYSGKQGIQNLHFGDVISTIIYENNQILIKSNQPFSLIVNNEQIYDVESGNNVFDYENDFHT